jgi:hypothetical protein
MVRRFINASKIEIYKKNPTAAAHDGKSIHTAVVCGVTWGPHCRLAVGTLRCGPWCQGPNAAGHGVRSLMPWPAAVRPMGPRLAAPTAVGHDVTSLTP